MSDHSAKKFAQGYDPVRNHFNDRINDLKEKYDHKKFTDAVCNIIWEEFKSESVETIDKVINDLLVNNKWAPTLKEFQEAKARLRENKWQEIKKEGEKQAKSFFSDERIQKFLSIFRENLSLTSEERKERTEKFIEGFEATRKKSPGEFSGCRHCSNSGVICVKEESPVFPNLFFDTAYACQCKYGDNFPNFPKHRR